MLSIMGETGGERDACAFDVGWGRGGLTYVEWEGGRCRPRGTSHEGCTASCTRSYSASFFVCSRSTAVRYVRGADATVAKTGNL